MAELIITENIELQLTSDAQSFYLNAGVVDQYNNILKAADWDGKISQECDQSWVTSTIRHMGDQYMLMCQIDVTLNTTGSERTAKFYLTIPTYNSKSDIYVNIILNGDDPGEEHFIFVKTSTNITLSGPCYLWVEAAAISDGNDYYRSLSYAQMHGGSLGIISVNDHTAGQPFSFVWYFDTDNNFKSITGSVYTKVYDMVKNNNTFKNYRTSYIYDDIKTYSTISTFDRLCTKGVICVYMQDATSGNILYRWIGYVSANNTGTVTAPIEIALI